jgi:hypothetical protein
VTTEEVLELARRHVVSLEGHIFDVIDLTKPVSPTAAVEMAKVVSKLSPLIGNLLEINLVELLNDQDDFGGLGTWKRQDPDFPDAIFEGVVAPQPGMEIKAWFPLATEITARFRDSQAHFDANNTTVALIAWLPEEVIFGRPRVLGACVVDAASVARARDEHYHNPPDYLVVEPEDTTARTRNLQQSNTAGYKWQARAEERSAAEAVVRSWGPSAKSYRPDAEYQARVQDLMSRFRYRLDTNFAKMDRIGHPEIEAFKSRVLGQTIAGLTISEWSGVLGSKNDDLIQFTLERHLAIKEVDTAEIVE